jgi:ankyrin repeat protein
MAKYTLAVIGFLILLILLPSCKNEQQDPGLINAIQREDFFAVLDKLGSGSYPNARDGSGKTALMWAAQGRKPNILQALIAKGADVNARDKQDRTALLWAVLYERPANIEALLAKGVDVNVKAKGGVTALMLAAQAGRADILKLLIAKGADANAKDQHGRSVLWMARPESVDKSGLKGEHISIVELLRKAGAKE